MKHENAFPQLPLTYSIHANEKKGGKKKKRKRKRKRKIDLVA